MRTITKVFILAVVAGGASCSIGGISYMDPIEQKPHLSGYDECNPPYWYPRNIPEHCYHNDTLPPPPPVQPIPVPIPVQMPPVHMYQPYPPFAPPPPSFAPMAMGPPMPIGPPMPMGPPIPERRSMPNPPSNSCYCPPCVPYYYLPPPPPPPPQNPCQCPPCPPCPPPPVPMPLMPMSPPIPLGVPIAPTNPMIPIPGYPYPPPYPPAYAPPPVGMVPGLPGIVSPDGGINVLPFSDAYSDILEKHKNKEFRRKYRALLRKYRSRRYG